MDNDPGGTRTEQRLEAEQYDERPRGKRRDEQRPRGNRQSQRGRRRMARPTPRRRWRNEREITAFDAADESKQGEQITKGGVTQ